MRDQWKRTRSRSHKKHRGKPEIRRRLSEITDNDDGKQRQGRDRPKVRRQRLEDIIIDELEEEYP
ncbi:MAG: hypothetical protein KAW91_05270 [candidate division Zixibacteria bacterium]|nr:hypothetical protein [candidate division Zixibacteria bacterium]